MASSHRDEISRLELLHAAHPDGLVFPHLADAYRRAGRYAQAERLLSAGLRRHAEYSSAYVVMGRLRIDQGKPGEAENAFKRVLQLDPQNHVAIQYLADLAQEAGRLDEALAHYRKLARMKPDEDVASRIEELEGRMTRFADGGTAVAAAPAATQIRGVANGRAGEPPRERRPGASSSPLHEPGEVVTETMAELYARQGLHERAVAVYRELLRRQPDDARLRRKLEEVEAARRATSQATAPPRARTGAQRESVATTNPPRAALEPHVEATSKPASPPTPPRPPGIRDDLLGVLAWRAPAPTPAAEAEPWAEPWAEPSVAPSAELSVEPSVKPSVKPPVEPPAAPSVAPRVEPSMATWMMQLGISTAHAAEPDADEPWAEVRVPAEPEPRAPEPRAAAAPAVAPTPDVVGAQSRALIALTDMLVGLLEYRDPFFRGSSSLTRLLADSVAEELGLSETEKVDLALAAVLRDLGRLALGGRLVEDAGVPTTPEGRRRIERHVDLALQLMDGIDLPQPVRLAVRHHHERWDGAGYPDALAAESIPRLARILAAVDAFTAMVAPRPYRLPRRVPDAAREMQQEAGTHFDPDVVAALLRVLARRDQPHLGLGQRGHILIVDRDQPGAIVSAAKLCSAGYLAEVAPDPAVARDRLRRVPVAALVLSAEAGVEAAAAFLRELRAVASFAALPVVVTDAETVLDRVALLHAGADVCFPPDVAHAELEGTLGALVRRVARSSGEDGRTVDAPGSTWLALQGDIQDFPLTWLLQVMKYDARTAAIGITAAGRDGIIYLRQGDAVHAELSDNTKGEPALRELLRWRSGRFLVQPDARAGEQTITGSITHLLLAQAVDEDHASAGVFGAVGGGD